MDGCLEEVTTARIVFPERVLPNVVEAVCVVDVGSIPAPAVVTPYGACSMRLAVERPVTTFLTTDGFAVTVC